jgi:hypothetical protein
MKLALGILLAITVGYVLVLLASFGVAVIAGLLGVFLTLGALLFLLDLVLATILWTTEKLAWLGKTILLLPITLVGVVTGVFRAIKTPRKAIMA